MHGAARRMILAQGTEYTVRNATRGSGGRDVPNYSDAGTLTGVLEQRGMPRTVKNSGGTEVETDLEIRSVPDSPNALHEAGEEGHYPTHLVHPDGMTYRVLAIPPEDSGVTVLTVVRH